MIKRSFVFASLVAVATMAHGDTLYNNSVGFSGGFSSTLRNYFADDFNLSSASLGTNPNVLVTGLNFGYATQTANASFDVLITFYQNLSTSSTDTTTSVLSNPVYTQRFSFVNVVAQNAYYTGELTLPGGGFLLPAVSNTANQTHGIEVRFVQPGTNTLSTAATGLFQGNAAPSPGSSLDTYYRDVNGNGILDGGDRVSPATGGLPNNFSFSLTGTAAPVPEPGTWAALGLGAVALLRRRKRA